MTATEARTTVQSVVEAHATHNTFYSIWSEVKERPTEPVFPFVAWEQWRGRLVDTPNGLARAILIRLLIVTSVSTERTSAQRDAAVEAADNAAADIVLRLQRDHDWEISNVSTSTLYDEKTQLDTGVVLTFTVTSDVLCYEPSHFTS